MWTRASGMERNQLAFKHSSRAAVETFDVGVVDRLARTNEDQGDPALIAQASSAREMNSGPTILSGKPRCPARCSNTPMTRTAGSEVSTSIAGHSALCESLFATLECELMDRSTFQSQAEARTAIFRFIEGWYNPHRRHSALGQQCPINHERLHSTAA
jgi:transposase InsO family protein